MCINQTVGVGGRNGASDVRTIQLLLTMGGENAGQLLVDGRWGPRSQRVLEHYQRSAGIVSGQPVAPQDRTMGVFRRQLASGSGAHKLRILMIDGLAAPIQRLYPLLLAMCKRYRIDTPLRMAHFFAQIAHETACLRYLEEIASGSAYEGRRDLGNVQPGDGPRFKGRGLIQLTGRDNYRQYGRACGRDFEGRDDPGLVSSDPALAVDVAGWFWARNGLNELADQDDLRTITRRINGGFNGLQDRERYLDRARWLLLM